MKLRFDKSRQTNVYILVSNISFFIGCMGWMALTVFKIPLPLSLFVEPVMLVIVTLFAVKRNEIKVIWSGDFYDPEYKDHESFQT